MKKRLIAFSYFIVFILVLSACGQGSTAIDPSEETDGIEHDKNEQVIEDADENEEQDETSNDNEQTIVQEENNHPVQLYFTDNELTEIYAVETTVTGVDDEVFVNTLKAWIAGPEHDSLASLLPDNVTIQSFEEKDGVAHVSFSKEILEANVGSTADYMITQQIALLMKQFGFHRTQILVDGEIVESLFGHVSTNEPIELEITDEIKTFEQ